MTEKILISEHSRIAEKIAALPQRMGPYALALDTDMANAERFLHFYGDRLRYCPQSKYWYLWDGKRWLCDLMGRMEGMALETASYIFTEAHLSGDTEQQKRLSKWAHKSCAHPRIKAMLTVAAMRDEVKIATEDLDASPWLLNLENGTYNLRTGELYEHRKTDFLSCLSPASYDEERPTPEFGEFIYTVTAKNPQLMEWLQTFLGYCITGDTSKQCFGIFQGPSGTGKSTLLNIVTETLGADYAGVISAPSLFNPHDRESQHDFNHVARCRLVTTSEGIEGKKLPEDFIKSLTGGERMSMREMYASSVEYRPRYKLILGTNFKPTIRESGDAVWRRMVYVPFENKISAPDLHFSERIIENERSGVLGWLIAGARRAIVGNGFTSYPEAVRMVMSAYRKEEDIVGEFLESCCDVDVEDLETKISFRELFAAYRKYREDEGEDKRYTMSSKAFAQRLDDHGIKGSRDGKGRGKVRCGVKMMSRLA